MHRQLTLSNLHKAPEGIRDTLARLTTLRDAWSEMLRRNQSGQRAAQQIFAAPSSGSF
jgi:flagellin-specific chaperone FliS